MPDTNNPTGSDDKKIIVGLTDYGKAIVDKLDRQDPRRILRREINKEDLTACQDALGKAMESLKTMSAEEFDRMQASRIPFETTEVKLEVLKRQKELQQNPELCKEVTKCFLEWDDYYIHGTKKPVILTTMRQRFGDELIKDVLETALVNSDNKMRDMLTLIRKYFGRECDAKIKEMFENRLMQCESKKEIIRIVKFMRKNFGKEDIKQGVVKALNNNPNAEKYRRSIRGRWMR